MPIETRPAVRLCQAVPYIRLITVVVFFYNAVLNIADEVQLVWQRKKWWSFPALVYLVTRYLSAACLIYYIHDVGLRVSYTAFGSNNVFTADTHVITAAVNSSTTTELLTPAINSTLLFPPLAYPTAFLTYAGGVVMFCAMILLQMRAYVICDKQPAILALFCVLSSVALAVSIVEVAIFPRFKYIRDLTAIESNNTTMPIGGLPSGSHNFAPFFWLPFFLVETVSFSVILYKAWKNCEDSELRCLRKQSLFEVIVRDNILYYLAIFVVYTFGLCLLNDHLLRSLMFLSYEYLVFSIMVSGVLAPNLFLSLRKSYLGDEECLNSGSASTFTTSDIVFQ